MLGQQTFIDYFSPKKKPSRRIKDAEKVIETAPVPGRHTMNEIRRLGLVGNGTHTLSENPSDAEFTPIYRILPIFSGIMIPFSIMLAIPSLTGHWYVRTGENGVLLEARSNPVLLDVLMALSLACGVLGNACLVIRFAERNIRLMTLSCIVFLTLHDLINIPSITMLGVVHRFDDGFTYGQSFWFTVCSTIVSTTTNITLMVDYHRTQDFTQSGSGLTHKQRSLVIIIIILLCYISLGGLILSIIEKISFIDALYFAVVSIETIGFGDIHPFSTGTRVFSCFYITGGILNIAVAVALARDALMESAEVNFKARIRAAATRQREKAIRIRWMAAVRWRLRVKDLPVWIDDREEERQQRPRRHRHWYAGIRRMWRNMLDELWREWEDPAWKYVYGPRRKRLNLEPLTEAQLETAALEAGAPLSVLIPKGLKLRSSAPSEEEDPDFTSPTSWFPSVDSGSRTAFSLTHMRIGGMVALLGKFAYAVAHGIHHEPQPTLTSNPPGEDEGDENAYSMPTPGGHGVPFTRTLTMSTAFQEDENTTLAESLELEEKYAFRARLTVAMTLFLIFWLAGSFIFEKTEKWAFGTAVYFCFISFTAVGYGDFAPVTPAGRSIFVVWALLGVGTMTILISILAEAFSDQYKNIVSSEKVLEDNKLEDEIGFAPSGPTLAPSTLGSQKPIIGSRPNTLGTIGLSDEESLVMEKLKSLPLQVLKHADSLKSLVASQSQRMEIVERSVEFEVGESRRIEYFISEIERSLQEISTVANDAFSLLH